MKRFFALAALVLGLAACQTEPEGLNVNVDGEQLVTVNVTVPEAETRAGGNNSALGVFDNGVLGTADDNTTMRYILQVYLKNGEQFVQSDERLVEYSDGKTVNFEVRLVPGRDYQFVVWADVVTDGKNDTDNHYVTKDANGVSTLNNITLNGEWNAMDESRDAFTATELIENYSGTKDIEIKLYRPFAKLRVVTTDIESLNNLGIVPTKATVTYSEEHYNAFNAFAGKAIADTKNRDIKHENFAIASYDENVAEGADMTLFTDYFFAENDVTQFTLEVFDQNGKLIKKNDFVTDIYVKRNYLTTIKGNILTDGKSFDVTIEDAFAGELGTEDGKTFAKVDTAEELLDAINKGVENITLEGNIDLSDLAAGTLSTRAGEAKGITIGANKVIILNLADYTITGPREAKDANGNKIHTIVNNGDLTVNGGTIKSVAENGGSAICNNEGANLTINNVEINGAPLVDGGWPSYGINNYGTMTINGAKVNTYHGGIATGGNGIAIIEDATVDVGLNTQTKQTSWALYVFDNGQMTVNGGTFKNTKNENGQVYGGGYICAISTSKTIINGGTFDKTEGDNNGTGLYYQCKNLEIKGGTFDVDPSKYVVPGYKAVEGNNVWTVVVDPVAQIGNTKYDTLQEAFEAGGEITLLRNVTLAETVILAEGQTVVLNLDGKTITGPNVAKDAEGNRIHVIVNNGTLTINGNGTVQSIATNGGSAISNNGTLTLYNATIEGAPSDTATGYASYAVNTQGTNSGLIVNNTSISGRGAIGATNGTKVVLNGGTYHTPAVAWGHAVYADGEGTEVVVNGGTFSEGYEYKNDNWGMYQIYSGNKAKVIVKGGDFSQTWDCANGYDLCTASEGTIEIYGGTFADDPSKQNDKNFVAEGYNVIEKDNTYTVIPSVLKDGDVLDLGGVEYDGTITVEGNVTIKGDTKITTLKSTTGCTITIEDGKTLTLNNFSFGAKDNANAEYEIKGGTVTANYGFFQHGKYALRSNFETGYMYYSYGSDITVYGTFHSQGKGDGLDYVRGKLTIAKGGKSIHDKSLWVGQPANWGAMNASLVIEEGGYVQANSLSVYEGSSLTYSNDADLKYNSVTGTEYITKK